MHTRRMDGGGTLDGVAVPQAQAHAQPNRTRGFRRQRTWFARLSACTAGLMAVGGQFAAAQAPYSGMATAPPQQNWGAPVYAAPAGSPQFPQPGLTQVHFGAPGGLTPVQHERTVERPLDPRIAAMPTSTETMQVIHHRSQLLLTRAKVWRISVTDPAVCEVVQYGPNELAILGVGLGTTDVWLWFEGQESPLMYLVTVVRDPSLDEQRRIDLGKLERKLQVVYPNSKVYLIPLSRKIIIRGQARDAEEAARIMQIVRDEIINQQGDLFLADYTQNIANVNNTGFNDWLSSFIVNELQVPGEFQVMLHVRIAELNRSQFRELGLNYDILFNDARHRITQTLASAAPVLTGIFESGRIAVALDSLASNGTAKILSNQTLVTLSGEPASFLAGGEFAVPSTVGLNGVGVATTTFRGFGTSLIATPTVVDHDLIRLQIIPELSELNAGNAVGGIPGVNVKRVQTNVELREGQTIVLGGMFSRRQKAEVTRIPWLGEIPVVGAYLFNHKQATEDETELLIVVTPEIVRPMESEEVPPLPGWYVTHPDDFDLYKYNRTEGNPNLGNYQLLPYGNGQGYAQDAGYSYQNAPPAEGQIYPAPAGMYQQPVYGGSPYTAAPQSAPYMGGQPGAPYQTQPMYQTPSPPYQPAAAPPTMSAPPHPNQPSLRPVPQTTGLIPPRDIQQTAAEEDAAARPSFFERLRQRQAEARAERAAARR